MKGWKLSLLRGIYLALACAMFYFCRDGVWIAGIGVMYQYLLAIVIILLGFTVFLIAPDIRRLAEVLRCGWSTGAHYLWILLYSLLIWVQTQSPLNVIMRGTSYIIYVLIGVLTAVVTVYMFGKSGVRLLVSGLLLAEGIYVIQAVQKNGMATFVREYIDLLVTFTGKTGPVMKEFENLNYAYMLGFFLLYHLLEALFNHRLRRQGARFEPQSWKDWGQFALVVPCFLLGLKRSVLTAMAGGLLLALVLSRLSMRGTRRMTALLSVLLILFGFCYIIGCYYGVMDWLESIGVNTMSRARFFKELRPYYEMGVGYFGKGAGFVSRTMGQGQMVGAIDGYQPLDIHNDYLRQYIELGFCGYFVWLLLFLYYPVHRFFRDAETETARLRGVTAQCFILVYYMTFMTENALYFCMLTMITSAIAMSYHFEEYMEETKIEYYGT